MSRSRALAAAEGTKIITAEHLLLAWLTDPLAGDGPARRHLAERMSGHPRYRMSVGDIAVPGLLTRLRMRPEPDLRRELTAVLSRPDAASCPKVLTACAWAGHLDGLLSQAGLGRGKLLDVLATAARDGADG
ncbi:hypothetical protein J1792_32150 [Streptomyces triculaminicus]|uniref:Uncharacterized protein n=1 Tax=Streptomyces triculaminicus TaxID=2816232 RepID=A0A939FV63_9ACTN|nr:hypothetical protein [Streptomyces triculaminicus]MBO0657201.1 hypothetical protein [Streptomyces triculaminicus]